MPLLNTYSFITLPKNIGIDLPYKFQIGPFPDLGTVPLPL